MRKLFPALLIAALALTACGGDGAPQPIPTGDNRTYDTSKIAKVDNIAALVPEAVKSKGKLVIAQSADYPPAEFLAEDGKTPIGYDVDLGKAIARVLGLDSEFANAEFSSLIPAIGSKYDLGISSFTIKQERLDQVNMISYITVGSQFGVAKGNPKGIDPDKPCGHSIGVQTGTAQHDEATAIADKCKTDGQADVEVVPYAKQSDVTTNLVGGKLDVMYADSQVTQYAVAQTEGDIEALGTVRDSAPQGVVVAKADTALAEAVQKAVQHLMDDGSWKAIATNWGVEASIVTKAELNPAP